MLSRSAAGLYWMGRYLERASHLSRLLRQQTESLADSPPRDIYFGWHRIYGALDREPLSGALELDSDDLFALVDSFALADDLTFEPTNPDSIRSCFAQGRENARQMRHHISAEMWTCLNQSHLRLQDMEMPDIWVRSPENFYAETAAEIDTFRGVTSSTLYRDDAWHFVQLGNYLERTQLSASLLMAQIAAVHLFEVPADAYWTSLLRHYYAFEAYNRASSAAIDPDRVLGLLVTNPQLPDSLSLSVSELCGELAAIGPGPDTEATARTRSQAEYLRQLVGIEWPGGADGHALLRRIDEGCRELHHLITKTYFDYPVLAPDHGRAGRHDQ
ncbi:MAG: alpha-E domain-containing protein [bacterium]|nr:alpha-E domain-containing protein [bacterium]